MYLIAVAMLTLTLAAKDAPQKSAAAIIINADLASNTISKNIYGNFPEHLGRPA